MSNAGSLYIANQIFSPNVMQGIYDVIQPLYPNQTRLQEAFFPDENFTSDEMIKLFMHNFFGMTPPTSLGADPMPVGIPGGFYRGYEAGYWGEYSRFENKDLVQIKNPEQPYKADGVTPNLWGEGMMTQAMAHQKHRFLTFKEAFCGALLTTGNFHIFGDGIDYYYPGPGASNYILDPHYRLTVVGVSTVAYGGWTTGGTWATAATATPIRDLNQMILYMAQKLGLQVTEIWMSRQAAQYLIDADETAAWVEQNPELSRAMLTVESGLTALNKVVGGMIKFQIDDRTYPERMQIVSNTVASTSTTCIIDNDAPLRGETSVTVMFHKADGRERLVAVTNSSNTLTFTASDLDLSMEVGDFVIFNRRYAAADKIIFKTERTDRMRFASLPCQTSPDDSLTPGVHTYNDLFVRKPNWHIVAGTFFRGGPMVFGSGGWATLDVYA